MRNAEKNPDKYFPRELSRMMLTRAETKQGKWHDGLITLHRVALRERLLRENGEPVFSIAGTVADRIVVLLISLYERLLPKLDFKGLSKTDAMWLLIENVFVPTVFVELVREWRFGLGTELQGERCWYLPVKLDGRKWKPVSRVLDCWLRVAGFRTAYGVSKTLVRGKSDKPISDEQTAKRWQTWKRSVKRWLNGEPVQSVQKLHRLVEAFAQDVAWLDEPNTWKARFTVAFGMQNLCDEIDDLFSAVHAESSLKLADMLRRMPEERIVCDSDKLLTGGDIFFAARLVQRRLQEDGEWEKVVVSVPKKMSRSFPPQTSDEEIAKYKDRRDREMNPGNWFLRFIKARAVAEGRLRHGDDSVENRFGLEAYIFELGVNELNRLLESERKEAGKQ